jgi:DNA-binding NtrC family response regulator
MSSGRLLLVAPDTDLRRSLAFALDVEGYAVTVRDMPPSRAWLQANRFDCTIADQKALTGEQYEAIAFCIKAHPVVLLANTPFPWLVEWVAQIVDLPLAENAVNTAIRQALLADRTARGHH